MASFNEPQPNAMPAWRLATTRRDFLTGGVGLAAGLWRAGRCRAAAASPPRARAVIFLLLEGGLSHLDSWDPKPHAPAEVRGEFQAISTANPALCTCEHLPRLAREAKRYTILRSVHSSARCHSPGLHWILTGYDNPAAGVDLERVNRQPSMGAIVAQQRQPSGAESSAGLPRFVAIPDRTQLGRRVAFAGATYLGPAFDAFDSGPVPVRSDAPFEPPAGLVLPQSVTLPRCVGRRQLLADLAHAQRQLDAAAVLDTHQQTAFDLLLGQRGRQAFDINREPAALRRAYGDSRMGQGCLLARRLVEAGVDFVLVNCAENGDFDTHQANFQRLREKLLPPLDQALATLLVDLDDRGLLDQTLVVALGEMGRTPRINPDAGRDHWPDCYSMLIAGGGIARGRVLGSSTPGGDRPRERPVHVHDLLATIYQQLGISPAERILDRLGREVPILPAGEPVAEIV